MKPRQRHFAVLAFLLACVITLSLWRASAICWIVIALLVDALVYVVCGVTWVLWQIAFGE